MKQSHSHSLFCHLCTNKTTRNAVGSTVEFSALVALAFEVASLFTNLKLFLYRSLHDIWIRVKLKARMFPKMHYRSSPNFVKDHSNNYGTNTQTN